MFGFAGVLGAVSYGVLTVLLLYSLVVWFRSVEWFTDIWADELTRYSNDRNKGGLGMSEYSRIPVNAKTCLISWAWCTQIEMQTLTFP